MICALPPTVSPCAEEVVNAVRSLTSILTGGLQQMCEISLSQPGRASANALPALHSFLSVFAALVGENPDFLTAESLKELRHSSLELSRAYWRAHHTKYLDALNRETEHYLNIIRALYEGKTATSPPGQFQLAILPPVREVLRTLCLSRSVSLPSNWYLSDFVGWEDIEV